MEDKIYDVEVKEYDLLVNAQEIDADLVNCFKEVTDYYIAIGYNFKKILDEKIFTQPLNRNINKDSRKNKAKFSFVVPRVYLGTRDSLGKGTNEFVLYKEDFDLIMNIFSNSPKVDVPIILV